MWTWEGKEVILEGPKDVGDRTLYSAPHQYTTALRWAAQPTRLRRLQKTTWTKWKRQREQARREFQALIAAAFPKRGQPPINWRVVHNQADSWMERWTLNAYEHGMIAAGIGDYPLATSDIRWVNNKWVDQERKYLRAFLADLKAGRCSLARAKLRAQWYAQSLDGVYYAALVAAFPKYGTTVKWVLGVSEHCPDCLRLARKTYTARTLPTTPRAGACRCMANCKCSLVCAFHPERVSYAPVHSPVDALRMGAVSDDRAISQYGIEPNSPLHHGLRLLSSDAG